MTLSEIFERYGLPIAALAAVIVVIWKVILPLLLRQIEKTQEILQDQLNKSQAERQEDKKAFLAAIERRDQQSVEAQRQHVTALRAMTNEIKELHTTIKK